MRRAALAATLALSLLLGAVAVAPASAAVPRSFYGIVPFTTLTGQDFQRMGGAKVGTLRTQILWSAVQTSRGGPFDFSSVDQVVAGAAAERMTILPSLAGTPPFEAGGCNSHFCSVHIQLKSAAQRNDWQAFVIAAARRYGPNGTFWQANRYLPYRPIRQWQIWNEQNGPFQKNSPRLYEKLLALSDGALHAVDPGAKIMLGGMFGTPHGSNKNPRLTAWGYLGGIYNAGGKSHFDSAALHPYSPTIPGIGDQIKKMRRVLKKHNNGSRKTYITEIGWGSSRKTHGGTGALGASFNVGPRKQKKNLTKSFKLLTSHRSSWKVGGVDWFTWRDPSNAPPGLCAFCYSSGLLKANGSAKPALGAFKQFTRKTR